MRPVAPIHQSDIDEFDEVVPVNPCLLEDDPPDPDSLDVVPLDRCGIANDYNLDLDDGYTT